LKHNSITDEKSSDKTSTSTTPKRRSSIMPANITLDDEYINSNIKNVLENVVKRSFNGNANEAVLTNKKNDMSIKILELIAVNKSQVQNFEKVVPNISAVLDKVIVYFFSILLFFYEKSLIKYFFF
jgi:hypothetical protein